MKIKNPHSAAFFNLRFLAAFLLFLTAGMLTLFAFAGAQQPDNNTQTVSSSRWLTRLASTLGIMSQSQPGGAVKLTSIRQSDRQEQVNRLQAPIPARCAIC